jgi:hypothetical protein
VSAVLDAALKDIEGPLVVVRTTPGEISVPPEPRKILVPLDSTAYSGNVLPVVTDLAASLGSSVMLCHIIHTEAREAAPDVAGEAQAWMRDRIRRESSGMHGSGRSTSNHDVDRRPAANSARRRAAAPGSLRGYPRTFEQAREAASPIRSSDRRRHLACFFAAHEFGHQPDASRISV